VALGPSHPVWAKLYETLAQLASDCGGTFAFVLDEGNGLWCVGIPGASPMGSTPDEDRAADRFYAAEIVPRMDKMRRGEAFELVHVDGQDRYAAASFASMYVAVVWFEGEFDPFGARTKLRRALPQIEKLTLALPPPEGPSAGEGAKARA
jgi:hypothetical protein